MIRGFQRPKTSNTDRIANPECNIGVEVARYFNLDFKDSTDLNQTNVNMLAAALKRMVVLRAAERVDVAELLKDPWFRGEQW